MAKDILLDKTGDLRIENGDFVIGESTQQEVELLLTSKKGSWKESPLVGANIQQYLKQREGQTAALKEAKIQMKADGLRVNKLEINNQIINTDVERL